MTKKLYYLLAGFFAFRLLLAMSFPLTADESYYWLWSKHLALSYVDHPPMIAFINFLTTLGQPSLLGIRLGAALICTLITYLIFLIGKEVYNETVGFWAALIFNLIPHFLLIWLTMFVELPLALFWTLSIYLFLLIIKRSTNNSGSPRLWCLLGMTVGLGYMCKITMAFYWPCVILFLLIEKEKRYLLKSPWLYLSFCLSLLFLSPMLYWNSQHNWLALTYHGTKVFSDPFGTNFFPFVADQLVHFTPFIIFPLFFVNNYARKNHMRTRLLFAFTFLPLICFLLLSSKVKVWVHWPSIGYLPALPLTVSYLIEKRKSLKLFITWIVLFTSLIFFILLFYTPGLVFRQKDYAANYALSQTLSPDMKLFAKTNVAASLLEFYTNRPTYLATGFLKIGTPWGEQQYELWGIPKLEKGEGIIYYGEDIPEWRQKAQLNFEQIIVLPTHLSLVEDYLTYNFKLYLLTGYKGGDTHP